MPINQYQVGDLVRCWTTTPFQDTDEVAFDPDTVIARFRDPAGNITEYTFGTDPELTKLATGSYEFFVNADEDGTFIYRIEGRASSGQFRGAARGEFEVLEPF